jgi:hypothetical protein
MAARTHHGSCACGKVRFQVELDLAQGTFKCNCTICTKARFWGAAVERSAFVLLTGQDDLTSYRRRVEHLFCKHCGVKVCGRGEQADRPFTAINLAALDDLDPQELARAPVRYMDGRHDDWSRVPEHTAHL